MSEIERAIEFMYGERTHAASLRQSNTDERVIELIDRIVVYYDLAMQVLRAELDRERKTCEGCTQEDAKKESNSMGLTPMWCSNCARSEKSDRYEPKG